MSTVYSINLDGTLKNERDRYIVKRDVAEPTPTGPIKYDEICRTISNLKSSNTPAFLFVTYEGVLGNNPYVTKDDDLTQIWENRTIMSMLNFAAYRSKDCIIDRKTETSEYLCVGDVITRNNGSFDSIRNQNPHFSTILRQKWLYVHKSICYNCPARQDYNFQNEKLFQADVAAGPAEVNYLYFPLGVFGAPKNGQCPAILKAFLVPGPWNGLKFDYSELGVGGGPHRFLNQASKGDHFFINTVKVKQGEAKLDTNYTLCNSDEALYNLISSAISRSPEKIAVFQGLMVPETKMRHEVHARALMFSFCNTELEVPEYPDICACIGRKGVEDALRVELNNDMVRMVCQSTKCLNGDRTGNVYTFVPSPPCAPINICKPGLDINAAKVTMSNVTFNCNFADSATTAQIVAPPPAAEESTPPAADSSAMDQKTIIAIGASVAVAAVIIIIIVVVVVVKRKKKNQ